MWEAKQIGEAKQMVNASGKLFSSSNPFHSLICNTSQNGRSTVGFQSLTPFLRFSIGSDRRQIWQGDKATSFDQQFSISGQNDGDPMLLSMIICLHSFAGRVLALSPSRSRLSPSRFKITVISFTIASRISEPSLMACFPRVSLSLLVEYPWRM